MAMMMLMLMLLLTVGQSAGIEDRIASQPALQTEGMMGRGAGGPERRWMKGRPGGRLSRVSRATQGSGRSPRFQARLFGSQQCNGSSTAVTAGGIRALERESYRTGSKRT